MTFAEQLEAELVDLDQQRRLRQTIPSAGADRRHISRRDGRPMIAFCTNDYLGLASDPRLLDAAVGVARSEGFGPAAARLLAGETPAHVALESDLASLTQQAAALLFPSGYQANIGVITALANRDDLIVSDAANHASIIDGCRLSRARVVVYPHADVEGADRALATPGPFRRRLLVTESLFSMDGDVAPLPALARFASRHGAVLIVDEAHALGVLGPSGRGVCAAAAVRPDAIVGTLGKAFGAAGGFVAGSAALRSVLVNRARTFVFTTASPALIAGAASAAIRIALGPEGDARRARLLAHVARARATLPASAAPPAAAELTPIVPVVLGPESAALEAATALEDRGLLVPAVRPPTVPPGTARLRVTFSADHTTAEVDQLLAALTRLASLAAPLANGARPA